MQIPSPILIFGDPFLSRNNIIDAKKKYSHATWVTMSVSTESLNDIRMEAGISGWDESPDFTKIIVLQDIPNRKQVREFLLDLCSTSPNFTKFIVWDSKCHIKVNPKTKTIDKIWGDFVNVFKKINGSKIINNGEKLTEKEENSCVSYVKNSYCVLFLIKGKVKPFAFAYIDKKISPYYYSISLLELKYYFQLQEQAKGEEIQELVDENLLKKIKAKIMLQEIKEN